MNKGHSMKLLSLSILTLLFTGCAIDSQNKPMQKEQHSAPVAMFQTVDEKKAILLQDGKDHKYCVRCGMDLVKFYKTSHAAEHDGKQHQYCSIHCLEDHLGEGVTLKNPQVVAVDTLKFISVVDAFYVVGSKKKGTMSKVSKYAFSSLEEAKKFQAEFGGEIMSFSGASKKAKEDFQYYK